MDALRRLLRERPIVGWIVAAIAIAVAVYFAFFSAPRNTMYAPDMMRQMVTIRFSDTEDTIEIPRGTLLRDMARGGKTIDPTQGIINPKTGKPTGFPFDKGEWEAMVARINKDLESVRKKHPGMTPQAPPDSGRGLPAGPIADTPADKKP